MPIAHILQEKGYELYFIGSKNGLEKDFLKSISFFKEQYYLEMQGLKRSLSIKNIKTLYLYFKGKNIIKNLLKKWQIDLVIGMGGYISGVVLKAAIDIKIKTIFHEQNVILGLSNKMVKNKINKGLLSFPVEELKNNSKMKIVGNPRTYEIQRKFPNISEKDKTIVIVGGSRGSKKINDIILSIDKKLVNKGYNITLITGNKYYNENKDEILKHSLINIIPFTNHLIDYLSQASLIISRSGATTMSEILALKKVTIFIPSPNVTNNHQEKNALYFVNENAAKMILEKELNEENLLDMIDLLHQNYHERKMIIDNLNRLLQKYNFDNFIMEVENEL